MRVSTPFHLSRRAFLASTAVTAGLSALPFRPARAAAKYRRYNVASAEGQKALASYAKGVEAMLNLPADSPQNWFRNAFIHLLDCPHGNWWFFVWHRGYLGYFEQTIRTLSKDDTFALPYWDWTQSPQIPAGMFDGVLDPTFKAYEPYTGTFDAFSGFIKPTMEKYWASLSTAQQAQQRARGNKTFQDFWNMVTGNGVAGDEAFAVTARARYLSRDNPKLDADTTKAVSPDTVRDGLAVTDFYNEDVTKSFTSSKTTSHNSPPAKFSILEHYPHNLVHNCIGGVGPWDNGPYGNMTNFLSPVDPIFFLHHANMDRLWDVWTNKQQAAGLPILPPADLLATLSKQPFLFYVDGGGNYVGDSSKAGDYLSTDRFGYDYEPGFGSDIKAGTAVASNAVPRTFKGSLKNKAVTLALPHAAVENHQAAPLARLVAEITVARPDKGGREFTVLVNAPPGVTEAAPDSPYYGGIIAFFGPAMPGMAMDMTFTVPLPKTLQAFTQLGAGNADLNIRLVPAHGKAGPVPTLKALTVKSL
ncbi:MAG: tyrosinase family protein [Azospirillaceae bacterium]|nr:tyrosinase family protein [Azospirillaceae bacterium]